MSGFDQVATDRRGELERVQRDGEEEGGLLAVGEQRLRGARAEIGGGERIGALLRRPRTASRRSAFSPWRRMMMRAGAAQASWRGGDEKQRGKDEANQHDDRPLRNSPPYAR